MMTDREKFGSYLWAARWLPLHDLQRLAKHKAHAFCFRCFTCACWLELVCRNERMEQWVVARTRGEDRHESQSSVSLRR